MSKPVGGCSNSAIKFIFFKIEGVWGLKLHKLEERKTYLQLVPLQKTFCFGPER